MKNPNIYIRKKIKQALKKAGKSADKLALDSENISRAFIYEYLSGVKKNISVKKLYDIAAELEINAKTLLP